MCAIDGQRTRAAALHRRPYRGEPLNGEAHSRAMARNLPLPFEVAGTCQILTPHTPTPPELSIARSRMEYIAPWHS